MEQFYNNLFKGDESELVANLASLPDGAMFFAQDTKNIYGVMGGEASLMNRKFDTSPIDFSGRYYMYADSRWVGTRNTFGVSSDNHNQNHGTNAVPNTVWHSLGIGFLPQGTILHSLEFIGRANNEQVSDIEVHLSKQGANFDTVGYDTNTEALNEEILAPTLLGTNAPNFFDMQKWTVDLNDYVLTEDRIIVFNCRPVRTGSGTRYWYVNAKMNISKPIA